MRKRIFVIALVVSLAVMMFTAINAAAEDHSVSGIIWIDKNEDGIMDEDEVPASGVTVTLQTMDSEGNPVKNKRTVTEKDGLYSFVLSEEGEYRLQISSKYYMTRYGKDSAALPSCEQTGYTDWFTADDKVLNIGLCKSKAIVCALAFNDDNQNGGRGNEEKIIKNVRFTLVCEIDGNEYEVATLKTTNSTENIEHFVGMTPGTYRFRVELPENYIVGPVGKKMSHYYNCFPPVDGRAVYSIPFEVTGETNIGLGIGLVESGSLEGTVWYEAAGKGLGNVEIELYSPELDLRRNTLTDENGNYSFIGIQGGAYQLTAFLPQGVMFAEKNSAITVGNTSKGSLNTEVRVGKTTQVPPIGTEKANSLLFVINESPDMAMAEDGSVRYESIQPYADPVQMHIYNNTGAETALIIGKDGQINAESLRTGTMYFAPECPEGYFCIVKVGELITCLQKGEKVLYNVQEENAPVELILCRNSGISGAVFADKNNDGTRNEDDVPLAGIVVSAVSTGDPETVAQTVTDTEGKYAFDNLFPGVYKISFMLESPYVASPFTDSDNRIVSQNHESGNTESISLIPGEKVDNINGGLFMAGTVEGTVLMNHPVSGLTGSGVPGVMVTLINEAGEPVSDHSYDMTDDNGRFAINGILPGNYRLLYSTADNIVFTNPDGDESTVFSDAFDVSMADAIVVSDVEAVLTGSFYGKVSAGSDVNIVLYGTHINNFYQTGSKDGLFRIDGILPDDYNVVITAPDGYVFGYGCESPAFASGSNEIIFDITVGINGKIECGMIEVLKPGEIEGYVFLDYMNNGASDDSRNLPCAGLAVSLFRNETEIGHTVTDEYGSFTFADIIPGDYAVKFDMAENMVLSGGSGKECLLSVKEGFNQTENGILKYSDITGHVWNMDHSSDSIRNLQIVLYSDPDYMNAVYETETDHEGMFRFDRLLPGEYYLKARLPEGYLFARENDLSEKESYIVSDGYTVVSKAIYIDMGQTADGCDIGIGAMGRIGDTAWLDENANGLQDIGEPQVPGIRIELYQYGQFVSETFTDEYGYYSFENLYPGTYEMRATMPEELDATVYNDVYPLINSVLTASEGNIATAEITVQSGGSILSYDIGFVCRQKGVYPDSMKNLPSIDWSFNGTKKYITD